MPDFVKTVICFVNGKSTTVPMSGMGGEAIKTEMYNFGHNQIFTMPISFPAHANVMLQGLP
jgi:hypothetical protein